MGNGSFVPSIKEQPDHLVLAIRVPKATIVSNQALFAAIADLCGLGNRKVWSTRADPPLMSAHREAYTAAEKAGADYNADPEEREEGPIADGLAAAGRDETEAFNDLLATEPRSLDGLFALVGYVGEVGRRQSEKGAYDDGPQRLFASLRRIAAVRDVGSAHA